MVKNLQQRFDTILRVAQIIVLLQQDFFAEGPQAMQPLALREVAKALNVPAVKESLLAQGAIPSGNTPQEFAQLIDSELKKWAPVVKTSGAKVD